MSDPFKELAEKKKAQLLLEMQQIDALLAERARIEAERERIETELSRHGISPENTSPAVNGALPRRLPNEPDPNSLTRRVPLIAEDLVRERNRPLTTRELVPLLEARGLKITGKGEREKVKAVSAFLSRPNSNLRTTAHGWRPKNASNPLGAALPRARQTSRRVNGTAKAKPAIKKPPAPKVAWRQLVGALACQKNPFTTSDVEAELERLGHKLPRTSVRARLTSLVADNELIRLENGLFRFPPTVITAESQAEVGFRPFGRVTA